MCLSTFKFKTVTNLVLAVLGVLGVAFTVQSYNWITT